MLRNTAFAKATSKFDKISSNIHLFYHAYISRKFWSKLKVYLWVDSCFCQMVRFFMN